jgi:hypothetical protein
MLVLNGIGFIIALLMCFAVVSEVPGMYPNDIAGVAIGFIMYLPMPLFYAIVSLKNLSVLSKRTK